MHDHEFWQVILASERSSKHYEAIPTHRIEAMFSYGVTFSRIDERNCQFSVSLVSVPFSQHHAKYAALMCDRMQRDAHKRNYYELRPLIVL